MPELPEVEITTRKLKPLIEGERILGFWTDWAKGIRLGNPVSKLAKDIQNRKILKVRRLGKAIILELSGGRFLGFHQKMSGKLLVVKHRVLHKNRRASKHIRFIFFLSGGHDLVFHDVRKFGLVWYGPRDKVMSDQYFITLGADALDVNFKKFKYLINQKKSKIKSFLLNQKNIAGVGNIMADEVLWHAKIHPKREAGSLREWEVRNLWSSLQAVLKRSIKMGGSTMRDWFHPDGNAGGYFEKRCVYDREGEKCFRCRPRLRRGFGGQTKIIRKKIAGRSSYYCLKCQI